MKETEAEAELENIDQELPSLFAAAVKNAYNQALASNVKVLVSGSHGLYQVFPDGSRELIKKADYEPLHVPAGMRVRTIP